jgi:hypothetical protein
MTKENLYDYHSIEQVYNAMENLRNTDPEMFVNYTVKELIDDAVTAGLMSVELGRDYLKVYG